jgi:hypothetical protein
MDFQQLNMLIPWLEQVHVYQASQRLMLLSGQHALLVVRRGHIAVKKASMLSSARRDMLVIPCGASTASRFQRRGKRSKALLSTA